MSGAEPTRPHCFACGKPTVADCLRCAGSVCGDHRPVPGRRCFACEWFGYHGRWIWLETLIASGWVFGVAVACALLFGGGWLMYVVAAAVGYLPFQLRPLHLLDDYKRRLFLEERLPALWYQYAIALRGGKGPRNRSSLDSGEGSG